jgi:hypothetical protein
MNYKQIIKKARHFKFKIDIIDGIFILLAVSFIGFLALFFRRETVYHTARFKITDDNPLYAYNNPNNEYVNEFKVGSFEKDESGKTIAEIMNVDSFAISSTHKITYIDVKVKSIYNPRKKIYFYKGKPLIFGENHVFQFQDVKTEAIFTEFVDEKTNATSKKKLKIETLLARLDQYSVETPHFQGVTQYVIDEVEKQEGVYNSNGELYIKITEVKTETLEKLIANDRGDLLIRQDPLYVQARISLELEADYVDGKYFLFKYIPLKIGNSIPLNFDTIGVFPIITKIEEVN